MLTNKSIFEIWDFSTLFSPKKQEFARQDLDTSENLDESKNEDPSEPTEKSVKSSNFDVKKTSQKLVTHHNPHVNHQVLNRSESVSKQEANSFLKSEYVPPNNHIDEYNNDMFALREDPINAVMNSEITGMDFMIPYAPNSELISSGNNMVQYFEETELTSIAAPVNLTSHLSNTWDSLEYGGNRIYENNITDGQIQESQFQDQHLHGQFVNANDHYAQDQYYIAFKNFGPAPKTSLQKPQK